MTATLPELVALLDRVENLIYDAGRAYHNSQRWSEEPHEYGVEDGPTWQDAIDQGFNDLREALATQPSRDSGLGEDERDSVIDVLENIASRIAVKSPNCADELLQLRTRLITGEGERCESGDPACGLVEFHDSEGVPLCKVCWDGLVADAAIEADGATP